MFDYPVVFVDIETTGIGYRNSRILEIAVIRYENGEVSREFSTLLNPESYIPANITALTGIKSQDVLGKPTFSDVAAELQEIMEGAVFIAHNVRFDYSFIKHEFARLGIDFSSQLVCTVRLSRALYSMHKGHSLAKLIERHQIPVKSRHRALEDARALQYFTELAFNEHGYEIFNEAVSRQLKTQSLPPNLNPSIINSLEDVPGVYIFRDASRAPLYIGKSITLRKRVMSHFQSSSSKELKISQQIHHIETIKTGSEFAALILESKLVKEMQPIYNRLLRRTSLYAMLIKNEENGYSTLTLQMGNTDTGIDLSTIYGIYRNRTLAKKKLDETVRAFLLCPKLMGLEKAKNACFSYSLGRCRGACIGKETTELYNSRFEAAFKNSRVAAWDYPSTITLPISENESVVIDKWIIQGYLNSEGEMVVNEVEPNFDVDEYKIIYRFVRDNRGLVRPYFN